MVRDRFADAAAAVHKPKTVATKQSQITQLRALTDRSKASLMVICRFCRSGKEMTGKLVKVDVLRPRSNSSGPITSMMRFATKRRRLRSWRRPCAIAQRV